MPGRSRTARRTAVSITVLGLLLNGSGVASADPGPEGFDYPFSCNRASLTSDFAQRDTLPQTETPSSDWYSADGHYLNRGWGPTSVPLPEVPVPGDAGCGTTTWKRERILAAAMHYLNEPGNPQALQYRHHHIPDWDPPTSTLRSGAADTGDADGHSPETWGAGRGLDCSNFTAWVYNYGLGVKFGGDVRKQFSGTAGPMGQRISADGPFEPGDLLYLHSNGVADQAAHVVIFVDDGHVIDSRLNAQDLSGIQIRQRQGWYRTAVMGGWRPITA